MKAKWHRLIGAIVAAVVWAISYFTTFLNFQWTWIDVFYILLALAVGYVWPNIDKEDGMWFLRHRDALTHSALIPVGVFFAFHSLAGGFFILQVGVHLLCDVDFGGLKPEQYIHVFRFPLGWDERSRSKLANLWLTLHGWFCIVLAIVMVWFPVSFLQWWA